jgi:hypothetical protein
VHEAERRLDQLLPLALEHDLADPPPHGATDVRVLVLDGDSVG